MKYSILLIPAFLISFSLSAQKFRLGPKVAIGTSSISDVNNTETHLSYGGGLFASFKFSLIGVQAEAMYQSSGVSSSFAGVTQQIDMGYLQVPILAKLYFLKVINIQAGPYYGLLLNTNDSQGIFNKDDFETSDLGFLAGVGVEVWRLNVNARYQLGFSDISGANLGNTDYKNRAVLVGIGFSLIK